MQSDHKSNHSWRLQHWLICCWSEHCTGFPPPIFWENCKPFGLVPCLQCIGMDRFCISSKIAEGTPGSIEMLKWMTCQVSKSRNDEKSRSAMISLHMGTTSSRLQNWGQYSKSPTARMRSVRSDASGWDRNFFNFLKQTKKLSHVTCRRCFQPLSTSFYPEHWKVHFMQSEVKGAICMCRFLCVWSTACSVAAKPFHSLVSSQEILERNP